MELPLTEPCPECGADMEPRQLSRHRRGIEYVCPECEYEMLLAESPADLSDQEDTADG